jgi:hypothetical protein
MLIPRRWLGSLALIFCVVQTTGAQQLRPSVSRIVPDAAPTLLPAFARSQGVASVWLPSTHWSRRTHVVIGALIGVVTVPLLYAATHDTQITCQGGMTGACDYGPLRRLGGAVIVGGAIGAGIGWFLPADRK